MEPQISATTPMKKPRKKAPLRRNNKYYIKTDGEINVFPSVTTILGETLPKKELLFWAARSASEIALDNPNLSIEQVMRKVFKRRDDAAELGKAVHAWAEAYGPGIHMRPDLGGVAEQLHPYIKAFEHFMEIEQPQILYTEVVVFNKTYGYAGTVDQIGYTRNQKLAIFDYKTGKNIYFDGHLQQEAYANAEFIYLKDKKIIPMPKIDEKYLVHLKPNGKYSLIDVSEPFDSFLSIMNVWHILKKN